MLGDDDGHAGIDARRDRQDREEPEARLEEQERTSIVVVSILPDFG